MLVIANPLILSLSERNASQTFKHSLKYLKITHAEPASPVLLRANTRTRKY
ncbi:hypothetical protein HMPREF1584_01104 [Gardnerella vaginalis JCP8481A]|nr:hypothetical protein HMPREF1585_01146 [Gardnerella vaginalis JCP8481B]EPI42153.1 hypothetical protein HMPREF1584_01104 [Gardnerella vaginalis JCP8481A]